MNYLELRGHVMPRLADVESNKQEDLFSLWNLKLLEAFFSTASKGDAVWLQIDPQEVDSLGAELGGDEGFLKAVRQGPSWGTLARDGYFSRGSTADLVARVVGLVDQRRDRRMRPKAYIDPEIYSATYQGHDAPTYLPFLAALVRSASIAERGFYPNLQNALQLGPNWSSQQMEALEIAWVDLEEWTVRTGGKFGMFKFRILGGYSHIGVPRSQSVMSRRDSEMIPRIFAQVGARPGQKLTTALVEDVKSSAKGSLFLTAGFKSALARPDFRDPIDARLKALFEDWDGKVPALTGLYRSSEGVEDVGNDRGNVELCLSLQDKDLFPWNIHWRVPPLVDNGEVILSRGDVRWVAPIRGTEQGSTVEDLAESTQVAAMNALEISGNENVEFEVSLALDLGDKTKLGKVFLRKAILRVFTWGYDEYTSRYELQEHTLPRNGPAYLLTIASNVKQLNSWLQRESIAHEKLDVSGLPQGWMLVCLHECSTLAEEQRNDLPDGETERDQYRAVRLTGGRSVSRAGIRQYMTYDLPIVELDAPQGTILESAGLMLEEVPLVGDTLHQTSIRRFHALPKSPEMKSFIIVATFFGKQLGSVTLRLAADSGDQVEIGNLFSLDAQGNPRRDELGLRGTLTLQDASGGNAIPQSCDISLRTLGCELDSKDVTKTLSCAAAQFLDTLAQFGSMAYGPARDQLARLLTRDGSRTSPSIMLLNLRSRGHLEIETNGKGHMTRIYSVTPTLYELESKFEGGMVFGVLGSLRSQHWKSLADLAGFCSVYYWGASEGILSAWRIVANDFDSLERVATENGFKVKRNAALEIAKWAAACEEVRIRIEQNSGESIGTVTRGIEKLNSKNGRFFEVGDFPFALSGPACQLFRMEDRDTTGLRVYSLGIGNGGRGVQFGFTRDSRWGVWIALGAFAEYVKETYGYSDASPWPIPYLPKKGTILLPALVSLPIVLERALNLCSGNGPEMIDMVMSCNTNSPYLTLATAVDGKVVANVSWVYDGMANGKWLAYRNVPENIARLVARKLNGTLASS
jgi:hypothetical protein